MNKKLHVGEDSLDTVYEGILMTPASSRHLVLSQRSPSRKSEADAEDSQTMYRRYPKGSYLQIAIERKERLLKEVKKFEGFGLPNYSEIQKRARLARATEKQLKSQESPVCDNLEEFLTPFEATRGINIEPPSYWFGCSYIYRPRDQSLSLTIRQTGVLPDFKYSKITVNVRLGTKKVKTKTVTLLKSPNDKSLRSSRISFKGMGLHQIQSAGLVLEVVAHNRFFFKEKVAQLKISLTNCNAVIEKTEWSRIRRKL